MTIPWDLGQLARAQSQIEVVFPLPTERRTIHLDVQPQRGTSRRPAAERRLHAEQLADALIHSSIARAIWLLPDVPHDTQIDVLDMWIKAGSVGFTDADVAPLPGLFASIPTDRYSLDVWRTLFDRAGYLVGKRDFTAKPIPRPEEPLTLWRTATETRAKSMHWADRTTALGVAWSIFRGAVSFLDDGDEPLALWRATVPPEALWTHVTHDNGFTQWGVDPDAITPQHFADLAPNDRTEAPS